MFCLSQSARGSGFEIFAPLNSLLALTCTGSQMSRVHVLGTSLTSHKNFKSTPSGLTSNKTDSIQKYFYETLCLNDYMHSQWQSFHAQFFPRNPS